MKIAKLLKRIHRTNQIILSMFFRNLSLYFYHLVKDSDWDDILGDILIEVLLDIIERDGFIHENHLTKSWRIKQ